MFKPKTVYIMGEVEGPTNRFSQPLFRKYNTCLRWSSQQDIKPGDNWNVNHNQKFNRRWLMLSHNEAQQAYSKIDDLLDKDATRAVLVKADYHWFTGYSNFELLATKVVPILKSYEVKELCM